MRISPTALYNTHTSMNICFILSSTLSSSLLCFSTAVSPFTSVTSKPQPSPGDNAEFAAAAKNPDVVVPSVAAGKH
jgi:hypothetical protein